MISSRIDRLS